MLSLCTAGGKYKQNIYIKRRDSYEKSDWGALAEIRSGDPYFRIDCTEAVVYLDVNEDKKKRSLDVNDNEYDIESYIDFAKPDAVAPSQCLTAALSDSVNVVLRASGTPSHNATYLDTANSAPHRPGGA